MTAGAGPSVGACLSLSGRFARFGGQAARGLRVWCSLQAVAPTLLIVDDASDRDRLRVELPRLAERCDLLLGPYSTLLVREAARIGRDLDRLVWNHGGSGDDVEAAAPGHLVSVLAPTSTYAEPFIHFVATRGLGVPLWLVPGRGSFGRQVIGGAADVAERLGLEAVPVESAEPGWPLSGLWDLFCAGSFEEDVAVVERLAGWNNPPRLVGAVAAGVHEFGRATHRAEGVYGIAQWAPGQASEVRTGPSEAAFLEGYRTLTGAEPDYPAVQAAAAAALATRCVEVAGSVQRDALWQAATELRTTTMFGPFAVDPVTGTQQAHRPVLLRWGVDGLSPVDASYRGR